MKELYLDHMEYQFDRRIPMVTKVCIVNPDRSLELAEDADKLK